MARKSRLKPQEDRQQVHVVCPYCRSHKLEKRPEKLYVIDEDQIHIMHKMLMEVELFVCQACRRAVYL